MWIRSQDKKYFIEVNAFEIKGIGNVFYIIGYHTENSNDDIYWYLGNYSSEEKALGILDEIQGCITGSIFTNNYEIVRDCKIAGTEFHGVYTMPKDDEVEV